MILKQYVVVTSGFKSPPTETHTLFSWLILIKSNSSSPPHVLPLIGVQVLMGNSMNRLPLTGYVFLLLPYNVSHAETAHVPCAPDISYDL